MSSISNLGGRESLEIAVNVRGEYSKYEEIREYKALKAVIQSRDFFL